MLRILLLAGVLAAAAPALAASALPYDVDNDGTLDLNEVKAAALATFDRLEVDHDGTLDKKELKGRIAKKDWPRADPDNDRTINRDEFAVYAETLFKAADKDSDGLLDMKEWRSPAGRKLERLLK
jgi:Ca2+-binding EF-hand superfamily protein